MAGGALGSKQLGRGGGAMTSDSPNWRASVVVTGHQISETYNNTYHTHILSIDLLTMHKTTCEPDDDASMNSIATSHKLMGAKVTD